MSSSSNQSYGTEPAKSGDDTEPEKVKEAHEMSGLCDDSKGGVEDDDLDFSGSEDEHELFPENAENMKDDSDRSFGSISKVESDEKFEADESSDPTEEYVPLPRKKAKTGLKKFILDCHICGKTLSSNKHLNEHIKTVHEKRRDWVCEHCFKSFGSKTVLNHHQARVHSKVRDFMCNVCNKEWFSKAELVNHMRCHTGEKPFVCEICSKGFSDKQFLQKHIMGTHEGVKFTCDQCGAQFNFASRLNHHMKYTHLGFTNHYKEIARLKARERRKQQPQTRKKEDPVPCTECGLTFAHQSSLKRHMMGNHEGVKFTCDHCGEQFNFADRLSHHVKSKHVGFTEEETISCHECGKKFSQLSALKRHMGSHLKANTDINIMNHAVPLDDGKLMCKECGKVFRRMNNLKEHVLMIHCGLYAKGPTNHKKETDSSDKPEIPDIKSPDEGKTLINYSERQMDFLKTLLSEFAGKHLSHVMAFVRNLKESDEEKLDSIINSGDGNSYREVFESLGVIEEKKSSTIKQESWVEKNLEVKLIEGVKDEPVEEGDEVHFESDSEESSSWPWTLGMAMVKQKNEAKEESQDPDYEDMSTPKKLKDPNAPKRPQSAFFLFSAVHRATIKEDNPNFNIVDMGKELGRMWAEIDPDEKAYFEKEAAEAKAKYKIEKSAYDISEEGLAFAGPLKDKESNAPKRPPSSFFLFSGVYRTRVKEQNPTFNVCDMGKELGRMWAECDPDEKTRFEKEAAEAKAVYEKDKEAYDLSEEGMAAAATPQKKDFKGPKRPPTSYLLYSAVHRTAVQEQNPTFGVCDVQKEIGKMWANIEPAEKAKFEEDAAVAKTQWQKEKMAFENSEEGVEEYNPDVKQEAEVAEDEEEEEEAEEVEVKKRKRIRNRSNKNRPPCVVCGVVLTETYDLKRHLAVHLYHFCNVKAKIKRSEDGKVSCFDCGEEFSRLDTVKVHIVYTHYADQMEKLKVASQSTEHSEEIQAWIKILANPEKQTEFACETCDAKFPDVHRLKRHLICHMDVKPYCCPHCGQTFTATSTLNQHVNAVHLGLGFKCTEPGCDVEYTNKANLRIHIMSRHKNEKPYVCDVCGQKFVARKSLKNHEYTHNPGTKPKNTTRYQCEGCGKDYSTREALRKHIDIIHMGLQNFNCSYCGKAFGRLSTLNVHLLIHTGEKPFKCEVCGMGFKEKRNMLRHTEQTHGNVGDGHSQGAGDEFKQESSGASQLLGTGGLSKQELSPAPYLNMMRHVEQTDRNVGAGHSQGAAGGEFKQDTPGANQFIGTGGQAKQEMSPSPYLPSHLPWFPHGR